MAGYSPFQFSSRHLMEQNSIVSALAPGNMLTDAFHSIASWYEMWINPENIRIGTQYIQQKQQTAGGIVIYHFKKDLEVMTVSGKCGWIRITSIMQDLQSGFFNDVVSGFQKGDTKKAMKSMGNQFVKSFNITNQDGSSNRLNNSPRLFLGRLKELADDTPYYVDDSGVEHYNSKYIKMFTKQYPNGVIADGYFNSFEVPESIDDMQTISYNFQFTIEDIKSITMLQRVAGMFSGVGSVAGGALSLI